MNDAWKSNLSEPALRLVTERPPGWEYLLFSQALADALGKHQGLKRDVELGISFAAVRRVEPEDLISAAIGAEMPAFERILLGLDALANTGLPSALGPPGVASDPEALCYVADRIGDAYRAALEWTLRIRQISTDDEGQKLVILVSGLTHGIIRGIEDFSEQCTREIPEALKAAEGSSQVVNLTIGLTMPPVDMSELEAELKRFATHLGVDESKL